MTGPLAHASVAALPAKITLEQARKFATSLVRGESNRERIALTVLGDRIRELV